MAGNNRVVLTEKSVPLSYIKESGTRDNGKHYLGKLAGIGAKFTEATRNGRRYPYELWVNVENSPDFKEGMDTLTIFGECDHPETRVDTSIKEIAIVLTKFEIRKDEGIVYTEFDILDTPNGRILKELLDYGSQIGVSSRGLGDEIVRDGEKIIDPDTYEFYGFDAVVMPAVVSARPTVVESLDRTSLSESFRREIENASTADELNSIKRIVEATNIPELDSVVESINIKLESKVGEDISSKLENDLGKLAVECDELKTSVSTLESKLSAKNIRLAEMKKRLHESDSSARGLRRMLQKSKLAISSIQDAVYESANEISELESLRESDNERLNSLLSDSVQMYRDSVKSISMLEKKIKSIESSNKKLIEENKSLRSRLSDKKKVEEKNEALESKVSELKSTINARRITEQKIESATRNLSSRLTEANTRLAKTTDKYLDIKCAQYGLGVDTVKGLLPKNYTVEDIDKVTSQLSDRKDRLGKVPIAMIPRTAVLSESISNLSPEEQQTVSILTGRFK